MPLLCLWSVQLMVKANWSHYMTTTLEGWEITGLPQIFPTLEKKKSPLLLALLEIVFLIPIFYQLSFNSFWHQPFATTAVTSPPEQGHSRGCREPGIEDTFRKRAEFLLAWGEPAVDDVIPGVLHVVVLKNQQHCCKSWVRKETCSCTWEWFRNSKILDTFELRIWSWVWRTKQFSVTARLKITGFNSTKVSGLLQTINASGEPNNNQKLKIIIRNLFPQHANITSEILGE